MLLHAHCAERALGRTSGDAAGLAMISEADAFMREQAIVDPEKWMRAYVPGFSRLLEIASSAGLEKDTYGPRRKR